jgi:hypothetical protein
VCNPPALPIAAASEFPNTSVFVRETGVEPARLAALEPKSGHSDANGAEWRHFKGFTRQDGPVGLVQRGGRQLADNWSLSMSPALSASALGSKSKSGVHFTRRASCVQVFSMSATMACAQEAGPAVNPEEHALTSPTSLRLCGPDRPRCSRADQVRDERVPTKGTLGCGA